MPSSPLPAETPDDTTTATPQTDPVETANVGENPGTPAAVPAPIVQPPAWSAVTSSDLWNQASSEARAQVLDRWSGQAQNWADSIGASKTAQAQLKDFYTSTRFKILDNGGSAWANPFKEFMASNNKFAAGAVEGLAQAANKITGGDQNSSLGQMSEYFKGLKDDADNFWGVNKAYDHSTATKVADGLAQVTQIMAPGPLKLPGVIATFALGSYADGHDAKEAELRQQGITDPKQIEDQAESAGLKSATRAGIQVGIFTGTSKALTALTPMLPWFRTATPLVKALSGATVATAGNAVTAAAMDTYNQEGQPGAKTFQQNLLDQFKDPEKLTLNAGLAVSHGLGEFASQTATEKNVKSYLGSMTEEQLQALKTSPDVGKLDLPITDPNGKVLKTQTVYHDPKLIDQAIAEVKGRAAVANAEANGASESAATFEEIAAEMDKEQSVKKTEVPAPEENAPAEVKEPEAAVPATEPAPAAEEPAQPGAAPKVGDQFTDKNGFVKYQVTGVDDKRVTYAPVEDVADPEAAYTDSHSDFGKNFRDGKGNLFQGKPEEAEPQAPELPKAEEPKPETPAGAAVAKTLEEIYPVVPEEEKQPIQGQHLQPRTNARDWTLQLLGPGEDTEATIRKPLTKGATPGSAEVESNGTRQVFASLPDALQFLRDRGFRVTKALGFNQGDQRGAKAGRGEGNARVSPGEVTEERYQKVNTWFNNPENVKGLTADARKYLYDHKLDNKFDPEELVSAIYRRALKAKGNFDVSELAGKGRDQAFFDIAVKPGQEEMAKHTSAVGHSGELNTLENAGAIDTRELRKSEESLPPDQAAMAQEETPTATGLNAQKALHSKTIADNLIQMADTPSGLEKLDIADEEGNPVSKEQAAQAMRYVVNHYLYPQDEVEVPSNLSPDIVESAEATLFKHLRDSVKDPEKYAQENGLDLSRLYRENQPGTKEGRSSDVREGSPESAKLDSNRLDEPTSRGGGEQPGRGGEVGAVSEDVPVQGREGLDTNGTADEPGRTGVEKKEEATKNYPEADISEEGTNKDGEGLATPSPSEVPTFEELEQLQARLDRAWESGRLEEAANLDKQLKEVEEKLKAAYGEEAVPYSRGLNTAGAPEAGGTTYADYTKNIDKDGKWIKEPTFLEDRKGSGLKVDSAAGSLDEPHKWALDQLVEFAKGRLAGVKIILSDAYKAAGWADPSLSDYNTIFINPDKLLEAFRSIGPGKEAELQRRAYAARLLTEEVGHAQTMASFRARLDREIGRASTQEEFRGYLDNHLATIWKDLRPEQRNQVRQLYFKNVEPTEGKETTFSSSQQGAFEYLRMLLNVDRRLERPESREEGLTENTDVAHDSLLKGVSRAALDYVKEFYQSVKRMLLSKPSQEVNEIMTDLKERISSMEEASKTLETTRADLIDKTQRGEITPEESVKQFVAAREDVFKAGATPKAAPVSEPSPVDDYVAKSAKSIDKIEETLRAQGKNPDIRGIIREHYLLANTETTKELAAKLEAQGLDAAKALRLASGIHKGLDVESQTGMMAVRRADMNSEADRTLLEKFGLLDPKNAVPDDTLKESAKKALHPKADWLPSGSIKSIVHELRNLKEFGPFRQALNMWNAALQRTAYNVNLIAREIAKRVPNPDRQSAITNWVQAGGDVEKLQRQYEATLQGDRPDKLKLAKGYKLAQSLTPEELKVAGLVKDWFATKLKIARAAGVLGPEETVEDIAKQAWAQEGNAFTDPARQSEVLKWLKSDGKEGTLTPEETNIAQQLKEAHTEAITKLGEYAPQVWKKSELSGRILNLNRQDIKSRATPMSAGGKLVSSFKFGKERTYGSYFEGEQAGLIPQTKEISRLMGTYSDQLDRAIATRSFIKSLTEAKASDGRPLAIILGGVTKARDGNGDLDAYLVRPRIKPTVKVSETGPGERDVEYPSGPGQDSAADYRPLPEGGSAMKAYKWVAADESGKPILMQGDIALHPEIYDHLKKVFGKSAIREWYSAPGSSEMNQAVKNAVRLLDRTNSVTKQAMLSLAPFHFVQEGTHAIGHGVNPFFGLKKADLNDPAVIDAARHSLQVFGTHNDMASFMEGVDGGPLLHRIPGVGPVLDFLSTALFQKYIPSLKYTTYTKMVERNSKLFAKELEQGSLDLDQVKYLSAQQANMAYGELNYADMGRDPTMRHFFQLALLAPDFLEARAGFAGQAAKGLFSKNGREQLIAIAKLAGLFMVTTRIINKLADDDYHWESPFSVKVGNREYSMRSVPEDFYNALTNFRQFAFGRISPVLSRGTIQLLTGKNYRGENVDWTDTMKELVATIIPLSVKPLMREIPGIRELNQTDKNNPVSPLEQFAGSIGLHIRRYSPAYDLYKKAADFRKKELGKTEDTGVYPISKYQPMRYALDDSDLSRAAVEYARLRAAGESDLSIMRGFKASLDHPFTGSKDDDLRFYKSLGPEDRAKYDATMNQRRGMLDKFLKSTQQLSPSLSRILNDKGFQEQFAKLTPEQKDVSLTRLMSQAEAPASSQEKATKAATHAALIRQP